MAQAFGDLVGDLRSVIDRVAEADPASLGDGDTVIALHTALSRLEGATTRAVGAFDASGEWAMAGARGATAWITATCRIPKSVAAKRVGMGRDLRHMAATEQAWLEGEITSEAARLIAGARNPRTAELFERDEKVLVDAAREVTHQKLGNVVAYWLAHADPDGAEDDAATKHNKRELSAGELNGMLHGRFTLDALGGATVMNELRRIEEELFLADWAEAKAIYGEATDASHLTRSARQRRADALVEMARRSGAMPAGSRLPEPLFTIVIDYETFVGRLCELAGGTPVTPGSVLPYLERSWFERIVFEPPGRIVDVSERRRFFRGGLRRGIEVLWGECAETFCDERAERCHIDHVIPYVEGGLTTQDNGRPLCAFHNQVREKQRRKRPLQE
ncbi:MAG TPA: DUF222 domain-containing protein [Acidimicrobiales bacterium]|nr:DUF222 domain-containing protein [Acidimicrobiales bacterium]